MSITPFHPFYDMSDFVRILARQSGGQTSPAAGATGATGDWVPRVDIEEDKDHFLVHAELPGVKKEDLKVTVADNTVTIQGEKRARAESKRGRRECSYGAFSRRFSLPPQVEEKGIVADFSDGLLKVTLPKVKPESPVEVQIQ